MNTLHRCSITEKLIQKHNLRNILTFTHLHEQVSFVDNDALKHTVKTYTKSQTRVVEGAFLEFEKENMKCKIKVQAKPRSKIKANANMQSGTELKAKMQCFCARSKTCEVRRRILNFEFHFGGFLLHLVSPFKEEEFLAEHCTA